VGLWIEELTIKLYQERAWRLIAPDGSPVDQFGLGNGEGYVNWGGLSFERREGLLEEANIGSVRGRGHCDGKVVNVGDDKGPGSFEVEGGDVYDEQKWGDGGSLRDPDRNGGEKAAGSLERQAAGSVSKERADPLD